MTITTDKIEELIKEFEFNFTKFKGEYTPSRSLNECGVEMLLDNAKSELESIKHPITVEIKAVNNFSDRIFGNPAKEDKFETVLNEYNDYINCKIAMPQNRVVGFLIMIIERLIKYRKE